MSSAVFTPDAMFESGLFGVTGFKWVHPALDGVHAFVDIISILLHAWHTGILVLLAFSVVETCHFSGSLQGIGSVVNGTAPRLRLMPPFVLDSLFMVCSLIWSTSTWANALLSCAGLQTGRSQEARHWHEDMSMAAASSRTSRQSSTWHSLFCQRQRPMGASPVCSTCADSIPLA